VILRYPAAPVSAAGKAGLLIAQRDREHRRARRLPLQEAQARRRLHAAAIAAGEGQRTSRGSGALPPKSTTAPSSSTPTATTSKPSVTTSGLTRPSPPLPPPRVAPRVPLRDATSGDRPVLERALEGAGIPYHSGLLADPEPHIVFTVPKTARGGAPLAGRHVRGFSKRPGRPGAPSVPDRRGRGGAAEARERARAEEERSGSRRRFRRGRCRSSPRSCSSTSRSCSGSWKDSGAAHMASLEGFSSTGRRSSRGGSSRASSSIPALSTWPRTRSRWPPRGPGHARLGVRSRGGAHLLAASVGGRRAVGPSCGHGGRRLSGAVAAFSARGSSRPFGAARRAPMTRPPSFRAVGIGLLVLPTPARPSPPTAVRSASRRTWAGWRPRGGRVRARACAIARESIEGRTRLIWRAMAR
jgi:hypothetical protein